MGGRGSMIPAQLAQIGAQATTVWALMMVWLGASVTDPVGPLIFTALFVVALILPMRHDGSARDRAISNFGAGLVIWSVTAWGLLVGLFGYLLTGRGNPITPQQMLLLTATVLYMFAGAFFWVRARGEDDGEPEAAD